MTLRSLAPLLALCLVPVAGCKSEVDKDPATSGVTAATADTDDSSSGTSGTTGTDDATTGTTGDDGKPTTTTNDPSSAWVVGEDATMLRLDPAGDVLFYPLETEGDLLAIACKGAEVAGADR